MPSISAYRTPAFRAPLREPPFWKAAAAPPLTQFIILSMLLHALAVLLFGAPSGGSREGRAMWGSLQVELLGSNPELAPRLKLDSGGISGERPRLDRGAARKIARKAAPERLRAATPEQPRGAPQSRTDAPITIPPLLDRIRTPDLKLEMAPPFRVPSPTPAPFVPRPPPERTVKPEVSEPAPAAPTPASVAPTPPVERPPVETVAVPVPAPPPVERPPLETVAAPVPTTPPVERPPVETVAVPVPATPPVERPPVETVAVPVPVPPPVERPPVEMPAIPIPPAPSAAPRIESSSIPAERAPTPDVQPAPRLPPAVERAEPEPRPPSPRLQPEPSVTTQPAPRESPFKPAAPASDTRGNRIEAPLTTYDPTAPALDLDAVRKRASQIAREGTGRRAALPFPMPPAPERKSKEAIAIEKARKPDCRTAYQDMGLLAVVPLVANEFGEGTCRW